jgi:2-dehydropantoate 2-reductase
MQDIVEELFTVIHRNRIPLDWDSADAYITHLFTQLIPPTRDHYSSMLQDIRHGKRTEIDALNGKAVSLAEAMACDLPVNRVLTALVKAKRL